MFIFNSSVSIIVELLKPSNLVAVGQVSEQAFGFQFLYAAERYSFSM